MTDWTTEAADAIEKTVGAVRERTVVPARTITKAIVFGLLAACFVLPALVLLAIGSFRLVDNYLPGHVWATWLLFGGIFVVAGAFLWSKRAA